jgi:hypothetical protein
MTSLQSRRALPSVASPRPLRPWPVLTPVDRAPKPKPLVMGTMPPCRSAAHVRTRWQPMGLPTLNDVAPAFPIEPANDPVQRWTDDDRAGLALLTLVVCVTVAIALLGFGLQVLQ